MEMVGLGFFYKIAGIGFGALIADFVLRAFNKPEIAKLIEFAAIVLCLALIVSGAVNVFKTITDIFWNNGLPYFDIFDWSR